MNRQHKIIWSAATQSWVAVSENTRAHSKKSSLSKLTMGAALTAAAAFALPAQAGCDVPTNTATAGSTVTCTGTQTGQYVINAANVTLNNLGTMTADGSLYGVFYLQNMNTSGFNGTNQGTINWTNAAYGGSGTGMRAAVNAAFTSPNNISSNSFTNDTTGVVTVDIVSALSANQGIAGIAVYSNNGTATATNKGTVTVTSSAPSATSALSEGITSAGTTASIINSGAVNVTNTNSAAVIGLAIVSNNSVNSSAVINNSGTVVVSGYGNNSQAASIAGLGSNTTSAQIINSGTLEVKGGVAPLTGSRSVVAFFSNTAAGAPYVFTNTSTGIVKGDEFAYGVKSGLHSILINNSGSISINNGGYAVAAFNGNDTFNQDAGSTTGEIYLGDGSNTFALSGGSIAGNVTTGTGDDGFTISGGNLTGNVALGEGNNTVAISGSSSALTGNLTTGAGADTMSVTGGNIAGNVNLGDGSNTFALSGGSIAGNVTTGTGDDAYSMTAGTLTGNTYLGAGNDSFTASGGALIGNTLG